MPFTAVGIGDMSGDVFGNGMLGSDKIKLVAAFDHRHVFIDPDPDPAASFAERRRLFDLPRSIWTDYDGALISKGGGVFSRAAKKISLSTQAQKALRTEAETVTPAELIRIILCAPVDVLWNGGIGTYVKATDEPNGAVGDKTNDPVRVNASQLRCRVVVEGGNLGLTQRGRIEYALSGGKVNSDFIDNSAGVNCSDREVNLKILSSLARSQGLVERDESHRLLERVVEDVIERILHDSFEQAQRLALEESTSVHRMDSYEQLMDALEEDGLLDRELEGLPSTEEMFERSRAGKGLTRPEIGVILAYAKRSLADSLLLSDSSEIEVLTEDVLDYFPDEVATRFAALIPKHPLLRQLVATIVASKVIDTQGSTFVSQLVARTGAAIPRIVTAHRIAQVVSDGTARRDEIEHQFGSVDVEMWTQAINASDRLVASLTRSYLREASETVDWGRVEGLAAEFKLLEEAGATLGPPRWEADRHKHAEDLAEAGFPVAMAHRLAMLRDLAHAPGILEVADRSGRPVVEVGRVFFRIGQAVQLDNLASLLAKTAASDPWKRWARQTIEDDLIRVQRRLAECALSEAEDNESGDDAVDSFLASRSGALKRVLRLTHSLESDQDLAFFMVVLGQIEALAGVNP
jgi:glutamate dehydrogenase